MIKVTIECLRAEIGSHPARIAQQRKRLAGLAGAAVADREHVRDETEMVRFERAAQRQQRRLNVGAATLGVGGHAREQSQSCAHVG